MSLAVDNPILNNPFEEPREYWIYEEGQPRKMSGRRPAGYYFRTVRKAHPTFKSHVSHVATVNRSWEHTAAFYLEENPNVISYVKNDHLDFNIPYDYLGVRHPYIPDFLVRYKADNAEINVILEVKGYESEQDRQKRTAAEHWVKAVNYHGGFGRWVLSACKDPRSMDKVLNRLFRR